MEEQIYDKITDIFVAHGLTGCARQGRIRGAWLDQEAQDRCSMDLILYHYDNMGERERERALRTLRCKRGDLFFDTGKGSSTEDRIIDYQKEKIDEQENWK